MHAAIIERFPDWATARPQRTERPAIDWVALGSEYDIGHVLRLWQRAMRFNLDCLPDDESIMWQLADKLQGRRSDIVRIHDAIVSIDSRHIADFREALDWLWDHITDEHGEQRYVWCRDIGEWIRIESEQPPITNLEDARRAVEVIDNLMDVAARQCRDTAGGCIVARRPQNFTPTPVTPEAVIGRCSMTYITNPVAAAHETPKTRDEIAIRDAVRARLAVIENAIVEFVAGQTVKPPPGGFSMPSNPAGVCASRLRHQCTRRM